MTRYTTSLYLALFNIAAIGLIATGWAYGFVSPIFVDDVSRISWISGALLATCVIYTAWQTFKLERADRQDAALVGTATAWPKYIKTHVILYLGLCGTLIGLSNFVGHMATDAGSTSADAISSTLIAMKSSMRTAFNPMMVSVIAKLWIGAALYIQGWAIRRQGIA